VLLVVIYVSICTMIEEVLYTHGTHLAYKAVREAHPSWSSDVTCAFSEPKLVFLHKEWSDTYLRSATTPDFLVGVLMQTKMRSASRMPLSTSVEKKRL
jgi:hypothetical protein